MSDSRLAFTGEEPVRVCADCPARLGGAERMLLLPEDFALELQAVHAKASLVAARGALPGVKVLKAMVGLGSDDSPWEEMIGTTLWRGFGASLLGARLCALIKDCSQPTNDECPSLNDQQFEVVVVEVLRAMRRMGEEG